MAILRLDVLNRLPVGTEYIHLRRNDKEEEEQDSYSDDDDDDDKEETDRAYTAGSIDQEPRGNT